MTKQEKIIKNLIARTEGLGGTCERTDYEYSDVATLDLTIGKSSAHVCIGPRGSFKYASTWFQERLGGWIAVSDKKSRPSWARAGEMRSWFWEVSRELLGEAEAQMLVHEFHQTATPTFNDRAVA